jgi:putative Ca2+/H+ antiporter (TMEM165/GDT1 family)
MAAWALIPDKADDEEAGATSRYGVFLTTTIAFFLVEMGDKTQIATVALGARFHNIAWVAAGTTLGMMLANIPAVYLGEAATKIVPLKYVRIGAALIFLGLGIWAGDRGGHGLVSATQAILACFSRYICWEDTPWRTSRHPNFTRTSTRTP